MELPLDSLYVPKFLDFADHFTLVQEIDARDWTDAPLARRVQHYGYTYDYRKRTVEKSSYLGPLPKFLVRLARKLKKQDLIQVMPDQCIINEYKPGQGISPHIDCVPCFKDTIATISLGWAYEMEFVHVANKEKRKKLLEVGSVLILRGDARHKWTHSIPARYADRGISRRRRISITFRNVKLEN